MLSSARLGHGLDRLSQQLPCSGSPDMSGENKKQLRVPVERLGELYERLGNGPLDLARLDPADLRSREAAPPRQPPHREPRTHARLSRHLGHRLYLVLHRDPSLPASVPSVKYQCLPPMRSVTVTQRNDRVGSRRGTLGPDRRRRGCVHVRARRQHPRGPTGRRCSSSARRRSFCVGSLGQPPRYAGTGSSSRLRDPSSGGSRLQGSYLSPSMPKFARARIFRDDLRRERDARAAATDVRLGRRPLRRGAAVVSRASCSTTSLSSPSSSPAPAAGDRLRDRQGDPAAARARLLRRLRRAGRPARGAGAPEPRRPSRRDPRRAVRDVAGRAGRVRPRLRRDRLALGRPRASATGRHTELLRPAATSRSGARYTRSPQASTRSSPRSRRSTTRSARATPGDWPPPPPEQVPDDADEIEASGLFEDVGVRRYVWETLYTADEYIALLNTFSGHIAMEAAKREHLYREIRASASAAPRPASATPLVRDPARRPPGRGRASVIRTPWGEPNSVCSSAISGDPRLRALEFTTSSAHPRRSRHRDGAPGRERPQLVRARARAREAAIGDPAAEILRIAEETDADIIVVGRRRSHTRSAR